MFRSDTAVSARNVAEPCFREERGFLRFGRHAVTGIRQLVLWLTTGCNLRCTSCYMSAGEIPRLDMRPEVLAAAFTAFGKNGHIREVQLAGGEPTLREDLVENTVRLSRKHGVSRISLQTNGVAVSDRLLQLLVQERVGIGLSLDGDPETNEHLRGRSGDVIHFLDRLESMHYSIGITTVISKHTVPALTRMVLFLSRYVCVRSIGLDPLRVTGRARPTDLANVDSLRNGLQEFAETLCWVNARRQVPIELREATWRRPAGSEQAYCPAASGETVVVAPDGQLAPCSSLMARKEYDWGSVFEPNWRAIHAGLSMPTVCPQTCALHDSCRGRCPARALLNPVEDETDCTIRHFFAMQEQAVAAREGQICPC